MANVDNEITRAKLQLRAAQRAAARAAVASEEADNEKEATEEALQAIEESDGCLWKAAQAKSRALEAAAVAAQAERVLAEACEAVTEAKRTYKKVVEASVSATKQHAASSHHFTVRLECCPDLASAAATPQASPSRGGVSIAIVSMMKRPLDLLGWLEHHARLGVRRFYLRIEDTPELRELLDTPPWIDVVEASFACDARRDYLAQVERQNAHVASAIHRARISGTVTHLLHIDDDELLFCAGGRESLLSELASAPMQARDLHLQNLEALATLDDADDTDTDGSKGSAVAPALSPFRTGGEWLFRHDQRDFAAYVNGKAIGRIDAPGLRPTGPHGFERDGGGPRHEIPPWRGCILHFESITLASWRRKFGDLAISHANDATALGCMPGYYRESVRALSELREALEAKDELRGTFALMKAAATWRLWRAAPKLEEAAVERARGAASAAGRPHVVILDEQRITILKLEPTTDATSAIVHGCAPSNAAVVEVG